MDRRSGTHANVGTHEQMTGPAADTGGDQGQPGIGSTGDSSTGSDTGTGGDTGNTGGGDHLDQLLTGGSDSGDTGGGDSGGTNSGDSDSGGTPGGDTGSGDGGDTSGDRPITLSDLERQAQRIADRQVNALLREVRGGSGKNTNRRSRSDESGEAGDSGDTSGSTDDSGGGAGAGQQASMDAREARMAFREHLGDRHRMLDASEREIANTLGSQFISGELGAHGDPDRAARTAAEQVATQLDGYRKAVERATVTALRQRGALVEHGSGGGQAPSEAPPAPSNIAEKRSAAKAAADRINAANGHEPTENAAG